MLSSCTVFDQEKNKQPWSDNKMVKVIGSLPFMQQDVECSGAIGICIELNANHDGSGTSVVGCSVSSSWSNSPRKPVSTAADQETASCSTENDDSNFYPSFSFSWPIANDPYVQKTDEMDEDGELLDMVADNNDDCSFFTAAHSLGHLLEEDDEKKCEQCCCDDGDDFSVATGGPKDRVGNEKEDSVEDGIHVKRFRNIFGNFWGQGDDVAETTENTTLKGTSDRIHYEPEVAGQQVMTWTQEENEVERTHMSMSDADRSDFCCGGGKEPEKAGDTSFVHQLGDIVIGNCETVVESNGHQKGKDTSVHIVMNGKELESDPTKHHGRECGAFQGGYLSGASHHTEEDKEEAYSEGCYEDIETEVDDLVPNENSSRASRSIFGHFWDPKDESQEREDSEVVVPLEPETGEESEDEHEEGEQHDNLGEFLPILSGKALCRRESSVFRSLSDMSSMIEPPQQQLECFERKHIANYDDDDDNNSDNASVTGSVSSATSITSRRNIFGAPCFAQPNAPSLPSNNSAGGTLRRKKSSSSLLRSCRYSGEFRRIASYGDMMDGGAMKRSVSFSDETKVTLYEKDMEQYAEDNWADMFS